MWAGPHNPTGSYAIPTHYGDGTAVYADDLSTDEWPDNGGWPARWIYGEVDYFKMVPPSLSCMTLNLPANKNVKSHDSLSFSKSEERPVVCEGMLSKPPHNCL